MHKKILLVGLAAMLSACGGGTGGAAPVVSDVRAQSLKYSQTASIVVAGKYLRSDMVANTGSCTNPTFSDTSTPDAATLNCKVTATGPLPITIRSASGELLHTTTLTVQQPEVSVITAQGAVTMQLYPDVVPATVNNFLDYVNSRFYTNTLFHRVIPGFVIQAGGYTTGMEPKTPPCQTSCRPIMIAESPHRIDIYEQKCVFN